MPAAFAAGALLMYIFLKLRSRSAAAKASRNKTGQSGISKLMEQRLRKMMEEEHLYTDDSLTVNSLAGIMGVSRTTMSGIIHSTFGTDFRDYINRRRIEYAKQYMLAHPKATQEEIAEVCGFKDGNLFNRKFKSLEGETPLSWLVRNYSSRQ